MNAKVVSKVITNKKTSNHIVYHAVQDLIKTTKVNLHAKIVLLEDHKQVLLQLVPIVRSAMLEHMWKKPLNILVILAPKANGATKKV
jgi:hypothetical protein